MEIKEIIKLQQEFDSNHESKFPWDQMITPDNLQTLQYLALALCGESGELANSIKKVIRGDVDYDSQRPEIIAEVTDVFIYVLKLAYQMDFDLEGAYLEKMKLNREKFKPYERE
jgi:NTP pyrophosphatase (non-canonical NTP hydrolase)